MKEGKIVQIIGPVVDVSFEAEELPAIYNKILIPREGAEDLVLEAQQHLGENLVRCVAMDSTDGLTRGMKSIDTGDQIQVPVGPETLGRLMNVWGAPVDEKGEIKTAKQYSIHREPPEMDQLETEPAILETGIKVIDLLEPYLKGGKTGLFGGAGVGKNRSHHGAYQEYRHGTRRVFGFCRCR